MSLAGERVAPAAGTGTRLPDFFIVGAPKSGTTALADYLAQHPQVFMPVAKELHYFGSDLDYRRRRPTKDEYVASFKSAGDVLRAGEASVGYLYSERAPQEILDFNAAADILIMLRNPIEMVASQHAQQLYSGNEDIADLADALAAEPERERGERIPAGCGAPYLLRYRWLARYAEHVERYLDAFGRQRVHVTVFDDFARDTAAAYAEVVGFLGCDPGNLPAFSRVNVRKESRSRLLQRLIRTPPAPVRAAGRRLLPLERRIRLRQVLYRLNSRALAGSRMDEGLRAQLRADFTADVRWLGELLGRDLSGWLA